MPRVILAARLLAASFAAAPWPAAGAAEPLEFNRDVRPILSENCFPCHGQDPAKREARLRLDERESATRDRDGRAALVPGNPDASEAILRIMSADEEEKMPPPSSHKSLTPAERDTLRRWIAEGAVYQKHWAFVPPRRPALPDVRGRAWARQPFDRFVLARLEREGLAPSADAPPETWLRRASFDLIGLPPTPMELDAFADDVARRGEAAYAAAVDRLLDSPHFGERQAIEWLDAARYADTHGFNNDSARTMWRWRDWVIEAFNANMPYDRFITEQLAGDLLPQPTLEQRIATGFGRNHVINSEGGIIDEEYRVEYVADRVRTVSTAWLGLTMECAKCHDHKFDPVTQRDYYRLFAFFNNVPEHGEDGRVANAFPMIPAPTREQQAALAEQEQELAALDAPLATARAAWRPEPPALADAQAALARAVAAAKDVPAGSALLPEENLFDGENVFGGAWRASGGALPKIAGDRLDFAGKEGLTLMLWLRPEAGNPRDVALLSSLNHLGAKADAQYGKGREIRLVDGEIEVRMSDRFPVYALVARTQGANLRDGEWRHLALVYAGGRRASALRVFVDGNEVALDVRYDGLQSEPAKREFLLGGDNAKEGPRWRGALDEIRSFPRALPAALVRARFLTEALPYALEQLALGPADRPLATESLGRPTPPDREPGSTTPLPLDALRFLREAALASAPTTAATAERRSELWERHLALRRSLPTAMVMQERAEPRPAFVLKRGQYDAPGEAVDPGVPEALLAGWPAGAPRNRLGLARWLTQPDHPLTARVVVNRVWAQAFGTGLVKTLEDFGSQSEWPSHPELLDWLAREFVDGGWNVKALLKRLVLSSTYRQSSGVTPALAARDPENRLLARGPRVRLPAELIRDQALAVSGLLRPRLGGPSVFPHQPEKLYEGIVVGADYPGTKWIPSTGDDLYRRSLYTFWKRTVPHPLMVAFDAPDREFCTVRRSRTNTPLQALALWNEPGQLEAARQLGARMLREAGVTVDDATRVALAFRSATGRRPTAEETQVLTTTLDRLRREFATRPDEAVKLLQAGGPSSETMFPPAEFAAAMSVASMILSLDETLTKP